MSKENPKFNLGEPSNPQSPLNLKIQSESQSQPENPISQNLMLETSGNNSPGAMPDFDGAPIPEDELKDDAPIIGEGSEGKLTPTGRMTYEVFDQTFCAVFSVAGHATGFKTLVDAPGLGSRPDATKAMYEIILDTPALHWMIEPSGLWMQRALALGMFFVPVAQGVANEMREKQKPKIKAAPQSAAPQRDADAIRAELRGQ